MSEHRGFETANFPTVEHVVDVVTEKFDELPKEDKYFIMTEQTTSHCANISSHLCKLIEDQLQVKEAHANCTESNGHHYLVISNENPEDDIIIDPTAGQFLEGYRGIFVGTRKDLKDLVFRSKIICTKSWDNPQEAFDRIWGDASTINEGLSDEDKEVLRLWKPPTGDNLEEYLQAEKEILRKIGRPMNVEVEETVGD